MTALAKDPNVGRVLAAAGKLSFLLDRIVLAGGCATGLLITDPGAAPVRATLDVDAIVEIGSYSDWKLLEEQLRQLGFRQPPGDVPICRWIHGDLLLDLMPTDAAILGFSNRWYRPAMEDPQSTTLGNHQIRLIRAPYFLATKLEAFRGRGKNDFRASHDLEDIVSLLDGRPEIVEEVRQASGDLRLYLAHEFTALIADRDFLEALPGHLLPDAASQQRVYLVMDRMRQIAAQP